MWLRNKGKERGNFFWGGVRIKRLALRSGVPFIDYAKGKEAFFTRNLACILGTVSITFRGYVNLRGNHTYFVSITYKDTLTTGEDYFMVKSKISYIPTIIQKRLTEILVWVFGAGLLLLAYFLFREKLKEKYLEKEQRKEKSDIQKLQRQMKKLKKKK